MDKRKVLEAINSLEVIDFDCDMGAVNYVHAENKESNVKVLLDAGIDNEVIKRSITDDEEALDLSTFAFSYAEWFEIDTFYAERPNQEGSL